jgi:hypothetical protein
MARALPPAGALAQAAGSHEPVDGGAAGVRNDVRPPADTPHLMNRADFERSRAASREARKLDRADARRLAKQAHAARATEVVARVTWLPEPVPLHPTSRVRVVGFAADCAANVRAPYDVA